MSKTDELLKAWVKAQERLNKARIEDAEATVDLEGATKRLGEHLASKDLDPGEKIGSWVS